IMLGVVYSPPDQICSAFPDCGISQSKTTLLRHRVRRLEDGAVTTGDRAVWLHHRDKITASDRINHNILIAKLIALGVRRCLIPWICDFLSNRRQAVKINESRSEWAYVNGGVPQGTKLGPILFLVMINDLKMKSLNSSHWKYVDDVTISEVIKETEESRLQTELNELQQWACENDMKLNGLKCKEMVVSFLRQSDNYTPLHINDQQLELVTSFKILGLTINNHLKWNDNVAIIVKKASKRLYILRVLRRSGIPPADLLSIYNALIRSVLEYACSVWHTNLPQYLSNKIERVQKRALRILYPFTDYAEALSISRCSRLDDRRQSICQNTLQKIANPCSKLYHLLPSTRGNVHGRSLRNNNQLSLPKCRTERFKNSFIPYIS
ncbi:RNA-directed DNA polymerase from mobile element jockey, partial [Paramuricea clavata]